MTQSNEGTVELIHNHLETLLVGIRDSKIKEDISQFFLRDIIAYLKEIDNYIIQLSENNAYSDSMEARLTNLNNQILLKGFCLETLIEDKVITNKIKEIFRILVSAFAYKSPIVKRAFEKPRGYPGDYLMLETVYNNLPLAKSGIALCFDKYFLSNPYAVAVRYRKDKLKEILQSEILKSNLTPLRIFDIACGSCRELKEIPFEVFKGKTVVFSCLDWDEEALEFSRNVLKGFVGNAKFDFIKEDIMNLIRNTESLSQFEKQNIVYSIGLIDYLPDRVLRKLIVVMYELLQKGGKLILTHKNRDKTFPPLPPDWFCDWKFVPRNKDEVVHLFYNCGLKEFSISIEEDSFNYILYITLTKH